MLAIPSQKLWTPRFSVPNWLAAHLKKSASTGHLLKALTGHLVNGCGVPCGICNADGLGPRYYRITIADLVSTCEQFDGDTGAQIDTSIINATHDLEFFSSGTSGGFTTCTWILVVADALKLYNTEDVCAGDFGTDDVTLRYQLRVNNTTGEITKRFWIDDNAFTGSAGLYAFDGTTTIADTFSTDCLDGEVISNETRTAGTDIYNFGHDGTATVVAL